MRTDSVFHSRVKGGDLELCVNDSALAKPYRPKSVTYVAGTSTRTRVPRPVAL